MMEHGPVPSRRPLHAARILATLALWAAGCERGRGTAREAGASTVPRAAPEAGPTAPTGAAPSVTDAPVATRAWTGRWEGRAVDPPLRTFWREMPVEAWTGRGELSLTLPAGDGPVDGRMTGGLALRVRGYRDGARVRATLEPEGAAADDAFRGTLDATLQDTALQGTWSASANAGQRARAGTLDAHP